MALASAARAGMLLRRSAKRLGPLSARCAASALLHRLTAKRGEAQLRTERYGNPTVPLASVLRGMHPAGPHPLAGGAPPPLRGGAAAGAGAGAQIPLASCPADAPEEPVRSGTAALAPPPPIRWVIPEGYNWDLCTQENYRAPPGIAGGLLAAARLQTDMAYHGNYTPERQKFQDDIVARLIPSHTTPRKTPLLLFTAGAMGVGKSFVVRWMVERGLLPIEDFALIDPDRIAQQLPEWRGYFERDSANASLMTRLEAGLITELGLVWAMQQRRNVLVDSSLRHGSWYASVLKRLRKEVPDVRVCLIYIHSREETIFRRAQERGKGGRAASRAEVQDSLQKMSRAVGRLLPYVDFFAQVANDEDSDPCVTSVCGSLCAQSPADDLDSVCNAIDDHESTSFDNVGWAEVRRVLARATEGESAEPLPMPPRILPTSTATEQRPMLTLLRTVLFAATKHRHQTRKDPQSTPYINHPLAVARILAEVGIRDLPTLQVALLHDTLEDTATTAAELRTTFGSEVADLVESLTDDDSLRPTTKKLKQLRGAKALRLKAKLVRIADKLHNVWDIVHHGIAGWSRERAEQYVAWACELVNALKGTHEGLERRFAEEVSLLPPGYQLGDWERAATEQEQVSDWTWEPLSDLPLPSDGSSVQCTNLSEHKAVFSLLRAAEFLAQQHGPLAERRGGPGQCLFRALNVALVLAEHDIRNAETLQAALVCGALGVGAHVGVLPEGAHVGSLSEEEVACLSGEEEAPSDLAHGVHERFGSEVASIVGALGDPAMLFEPHRLPYQAKLILLAEHFWDLKELQVEGLSSEAAVAAFRLRGASAARARKALAGVHAGLEAGIDEVFGGHVRTASGALVPVGDALKAPAH